MIPLLIMSGALRAIHTLNGLSRRVFLLSQLRRKKTEAKTTGGIMPVVIAVNNKAVVIALTQRQFDSLMNLPDVVEGIEHAFLLQQAQLVYDVAKRTQGRIVGEA